MSNFRHEQVQVGPLSLHVAELGDPQARPVVFLHGWPQCWAEWRQVMELAAAEFRALAIDLPGIGQSSPGSTDGSKRELAAAVHGLIGRLGLDRPVIVGHDVGGMTAYAYLRGYQDVAGVVIIDVAIPGIDPWEEVIRNPYIWHFAFHSIPALPEVLTQGRQGPYFDYFYDVLAADPARIAPDARAAYAQAYATDAGLTAGFGFYRAFPQDARDNLAHSGAATDTPGPLHARGGRPRKHRQLRARPAGSRNPAPDNQAHPGRRPFHPGRAAGSAMAAHTRVHHQQRCPPPASPRRRQAWMTSPGARRVAPGQACSAPVGSEALAWPGRLIEGHGWHYEIWSGADPVLLANLRFLAGYRRTGLLPEGQLDDILAAVMPGDTIGGVISRMPRARRPGEVKAAVLSLLWQQRLATDLHGHLGSGSTLEVTA